MKWQKIAAVIWCCSFFLFQPSASWAKSLKVPHQFSSISAALDMAAAGDEILVAPGTYKEYIALKEGVILRSRGTDGERSNFTCATRTILQAPGTHTQIVLGAQGAVLDGFTIQNIKVMFALQNEEYGILIKGTATTITNCIIASLPYTGIQINGPTPKGQSIIKNNKIYDNQGNGITCDQEANVLIESNEIYLNVKSGIENSHKSQVTVEDNLIYENDVDGIMNTDSALPIIVKNKIYKNGLNGIGLQRKSKGKVMNNTITGNRQAGIGIRMEAECAIINNNISENMIGIGMMDIKEVLVESNKIIGNRIGIGLVRCTGGKVILRKNDLRRNMIISISPNMDCELIQEDNQQ